MDINGGTNKFDLSPEFKIQYQFQKKINKILESWKQPKIIRTKNFQKFHKNY